MGGSEIIVILIVALLFLGPDKLPEAAKLVSKGIRDIKKQSRNLQQTIENDERIGGAIRDLKSALRGEEAPYVAPKKKVVDIATPEEEAALDAAKAEHDAAIHAAALIAPAVDPAEVVADAKPTTTETDAATLAARLGVKAEAVPAANPYKSAPLVPPKVQLVTSAGEVEPDSDDDADDADLAAMIKPAAGSVPKGSSEPAPADDKRHG